MYKKILKIKTIKNMFTKKNKNIHIQDTISESKFVNKKNYIIEKKKLLKNLRKTNLKYISSKFRPLK